MSAFQFALVKASVRIEEVIAQSGVSLTAAGDRSVGHCPFHRDTTPSFTVYLSSQRYYCFGCGAHGDVLDFVAQREGCSLQEAAERLANASSCSSMPIATQPLPHTVEPPRQEEVLPLTPQERDLLTLMQQCYHDCLLNSSRASDYVRQRGITDEGIRQCELGYADGTMLKRALAEYPGYRKAASSVSLQDASSHERLAGRIIIPECADGRCTWMIGRMLGDQPGRVKYLGLKRAKPLLGYGRALARLSRASASIEGILVVEGALDYVIATQWALPVFCVALVGTYASHAQLAALQALQVQAGDVPIILGLDADEAGRQATSRLLKQLCAQYCQVVTLPPVSDVKDLGELALRVDGRAVLMQAIDDALAEWKKHMSRQGHHYEKTKGRREKEGS